MTRFKPAGFMIFTLNFGGERKMKKTKSITLLLSPVLSTMLLAACGGSSSSPMDRDVYASREDCLKDWNAEELCQRMNDQDERQYQSSHGITHPVFWGPHYYGSDRTVTYQGRTISPTTRSSTMESYHITSSSSSASRTSASSPRSTSYSSTTGGFGSHGPSSSGS